jgi:plastocyanin
MFSRLLRIPRPFHALFAALAGTLVVGALWGLRAAGADHAHTAHTAADHPAHAMSEEEMQRGVDAWFAAHPVVGGKEVTGAPVATFRAFSNKFDADGSLTATPVDTVIIGVGETIQWQRLIGAHTVTNGFTATEPGSGEMIDVPLDAANPVFLYTYEQGGTFPFFCRTHDDLTMVGVVVVIGAVPTVKTSWGGLKALSR